MNKQYTLLTLLAPLLFLYNSQAQTSTTAANGTSIYLDTLKKPATQLKSVQVSAVSSGSLQQSNRAVTVIDAKKIL
ncbi:hypothetical protein [Paraflavitalea speifideaquila]|uniref:hypothetical protein n=1 Tax=Paraflavitalea speifideaquila TaxID=3076558 RepID=UPI0028EAE39D|nr:hypothetical protein [Paraflavitalea speifideiaquila]